MSKFRIKASDFDLISFDLRSKIRFFLSNSKSHLVESQKLNFT